MPARKAKEESADVNADINEVMAMSSVDHAQVDRLAEEIPEPDDALFHTLDAQERTREQLSNEPPLRAMVVLVTDFPEEKAKNGELVAELLAEEGFLVDAVLNVESRKSAIRKVIQTAVVGGADLVVTIGGTGTGPRDKTPEATRAELTARVRASLKPCAPPVWRLTPWTRACPAESPVFPVRPWWSTSPDPAARSAMAWPLLAHWFATLSAT